MASTLEKPQDWKFVWEEGQRGHFSSAGYQTMAPVCRPDEAPRSSSSGSELSGKPQASSGPPPGEAPVIPVGQKARREAQGSSQTVAESAAVREPHPNVHRGLRDPALLGTASPAAPMELGHPGLGSNALSTLNVHSRK